MIKVSIIKNSKALFVLPICAANIGGAISIRLKTYISNVKEVCTAFFPMLFQQNIFIFAKLHYYRKEKHLHV